jgi:hypothetical protein
MNGGVPEGQAVVLDVAQLQALLSNTFNLGLDVGRGKEKVALVRLRLAKALIGAAEANAVAAESIAIQRGVSTEEIAQTETLALACGGVNGMPDPVIHPAARAMGIITGLAAIETDPRAPKNDLLLDAALSSKRPTARLLNAAAELKKATETVSGLLELARMTAASGRTGKSDLN